MPRSTSVVYVRKAEQVPSVEHWAILKTSSYTTAACGEWAPGHGYPASTENYIEYTAYTDKAEFEAEFERALLDRFGGVVRAIHVLPMTAKTTVTLHD